MSLCQQKRDLGSYFLSFIVPSSHGISLGSVSGQCSCGRREKKETASCSRWAGICQAQVYPPWKSRRGLRLGVCPELWPSPPSLCGPCSPTLPERQLDSGFTSLVPLPPHRSFVEGSAFAMPLSIGLSIPMTSVPDLSCLDRGNSLQWVDDGNSCYCSILKDNDVEYLITTMATAEWQEPTHIAFTVGQAQFKILDPY